MAANTAAIQANLRVTKIEIDLDPLTNAATVFVEYEVGNGGAIHRIQAAPANLPPQGYFDNMAATVLPWAVTDFQSNP